MHHLILPPGLKESTMMVKQQDGIFTGLAGRAGSMQSMQQAGQIVASKRTGGPWYSLYHMSCTVQVSR